MAIQVYATGETIINSSATISDLAFFEPGAYLNISAGATVTFNNTITSSKQHIFRGAGTVVLGHNTTTGRGEQARYAHVSWFGAFPGYRSSGDQAPAIQKAVNSFGNGRESVLEFDIGNYNIDTPISVTRACWIKGSGRRRTVFKTGTDGFDLFTTANVGVYFTDFQFELDLDVLPIRTNGALIVLAHTGCVVREVGVAHSHTCIKVSALQCIVEDIGGGSGTYPGVGSSVVLVQAGNCSIRGIKNQSTVVGPDSQVLIAPTSTLSGVSIRDIEYTQSSRAIDIDASSASIYRILANGITYNSFAGSPPPQIIRMRTAGDFNIGSVVISDVITTGYETAGFAIEQASTGETSDISINNCVFGGSAGYAGTFTRTAGTLRDVNIGDGVMSPGRAVPFSFSGTIRNVRVAGSAVNSTNPAISTAYSIEDDTASIFNPRRSIISGTAIVAVGNDTYGIYHIRAASTPRITVIQQSTLMAAVATPLSGTTGVDGKFTVGVGSDGRLYLENRLGSRRDVSFTVLMGGE